MYKVDKGIAITNSGRGCPKYPWDALEIGDSFFVPSTDFPNSGFRGIRPSIRLLENGYKISCRKVTENDVNGVRFWRIK